MNYKQILTSIFLLKIISTLSASDSSAFYHSAFNRDVHVDEALQSLKATYQARVAFIHAAKSDHTAQTIYCFRGLKTDEENAQMTARIVSLRAREFTEAKISFARFPEPIRQQARNLLQEEYLKPCKPFLLPEDPAE